MGFFSKIGRGFKKVFKKIGKGIKTGLKSVGKAVGKAGILGQIALMFILPGIGGALAKGFSGLTQGLLGAGSAAARGVGHILSYAGKFASTAGKLYKTVTNGISGFVKKVGGEVLNKLGFTSFGNGKGVTKAFQGWVKNVSGDFKESFNPWSLDNVDFAKGLAPAKGGKFTAEDVKNDPMATTANDHGQFIDYADKKASMQASQSVHDEFLKTAKNPGDSNWFGDLKDDVVRTAKGIPRDLIQGQISGLLNPQEEYEVGAPQVAPRFSDSNPLVYSPAVASLGYNYGDPANAFQFIGSNFNYDPNIYNNTLQRGLS